MKSTHSDAVHSIETRGIHSRTIYTVKNADGNYIGTVSCIAPGHWRARGAHFPIEREARTRDMAEARLIAALSTYNKTKGA